MRVLLDWNAYAQLMRVWEQLSRIVRGAEEVSLSAVVFGELPYGFRSGSRYGRNARRMRASLDNPYVSVVPVGETTSDRHSRIAASLRAKGRPILTDDLWIAAHAMETGADLGHRVVRGGSPHENRHGRVSSRPRTNRALAGGRRRHPLRVGRALGDSRRELVFIAQAMPRGIIEGALERCLLTGLEMAEGPTNGGTSPNRLRTVMCPDRLRRRVPSRTRRLEPSQEATPTGVRGHGPDHEIRSVAIRTLLSGGATTGQGEGAKVSARPTVSPPAPPIQPSPTPLPEHPTGTGNRSAGGSGPVPT